MQLSSYGYLLELQRTDPNNPDTDSDGFWDGVEIGALIDPNNADADGDGILDGFYDGQDTDGDGLTDIAETTFYGTNPNKRDTDNDGVDDGDEVFNGTDPTRNSYVIANPSKPAGGHYFRAIAAQFRWKI